MTRGRKAVILLLLLLGLLLASIAGYLLLFPEEEAFERQEEEADLADAYVTDLVRREEARYSLGDVETEKEDAPSTPVEDEAYYTRGGVTYTPDYAKGYVECVLNYPRLGIHRGVYSGEWDEILYDLDIWMVTAARPDYELGETHYAIYGHNHTVQKLSFNELAKAALGDTFTLTAPSGVYTYEVDKIYADWRTEVAKHVVDDFSHPAEECYIITCGRNENRYKDLIVRGRLIDHKTVKEYALEQLYARTLPYDVSFEEGVLSVCQYLPDGSINTGSEHELTDEDGKAVARFTLGDVPEEITGLTDGIYRLRTVKQPDGVLYGESDYSITIRKSAVVTFEPVTVKAESPEKHTVFEKVLPKDRTGKKKAYAAIAGGAVLAIMAVACLVLFRKKAEEE